jgi:hypothetical protein
MEIEPIVPTTAPPGKATATDWPGKRTKPGAAQPKPLAARFHGLKEQITDQYVIV